MSYFDDIEHWYINGGDQGTLDDLTEMPQTGDRMTVNGEELEVNYVDSYRADGFAFVWFRCITSDVEAPAHGMFKNPATKDTNPKDAIGCTKPPTHFISKPVLYEIGNALLEGACKYGAHNWRVAGVRASVYDDAAKRHLDAWWEGEDIDPDSGMHHITKAIAGLIVIRDAMIFGMFKDDRPPKSPPGWMAEAQKQTDAILKKYPNPKAPNTEL